MYVCMYGAIGKAAFVGRAICVSGAIAEAYLSPGKHCGPCKDLFTFTFQTLF
jgi:hypothetical protein